LLLLQQPKSVAKLLFQVLGFELFFEQSRLIPLKQIPEFSCLKMINDYVSVPVRVLPAEFSSGEECARLRRGLVQKSDREFLCERRIGNLALQKAT
jgi:hypothetical protein